MTRLRVRKNPRSTHARGVFTGTEAVTAAGLLDDVEALVETLFVDVSKSAVMCGEVGAIRLAGIVPSGWTGWSSEGSRPSESERGQSGRPLLMSAVEHSFHGMTILLEQGSAASLECCPYPRTPVTCVPDLYNREGLGGGHLRTEEPPLNPPREGGEGFSGDGARTWRWLAASYRSADGGTHLLPLAGYPHPLREAQGTAGRQVGRV